MGGGLRSPYRTPNEIDDDAYAAKVAAVGAVDVLCAHIPPAVPELLYDTVARRMERGSEALLGQIRRTQPRYVLFGHVHQPLARRVRIGRTECINVGHFRATGGTSWRGSARTAVAVRSEHGGQDDIQHRRSPRRGRTSWR